MKARMMKISFETMTYATLAIVTTMTMAALLNAAFDVRVIA